MLAAIVIGVPVGLGLGLLSVGILSLFFTLTPPLLTVAVWPLLGFVLFMAFASTVALVGRCSR